ncbi:acetyltransferase [Halobacteroides halobius DSM 5150]|uniref:Acetyltransferase n=1 Tax=Halobacteroides halobius (strain ATCC 35273 / DSM 5150 / MD-1) TaxID=748449 RepID=L0KCL1_HALHC|nr:GNAT family N-acetyltransferase [Halobacteroides halobius]AGB41793.1 acetyltransferase [Halobacteroides halobius DSM 5150]
MAVKIERLTTNNFDVIKEIVQIEVEAFGEGGLNQWGLTPLLHHGAVYVLYIADKPVGVIEYLRDMEEVNQAYLYGLAVNSDYQGQGLGEQLLDYSLQQLQKLGIVTVELTVAPNNQAALKLYQKFGFKKKEFRKQEYGPNEDRLIMQLRF